MESNLARPEFKAVLIGSDHKPIASGGHDWENQLENGVWTYSLESVKLGLQDAYAKLVKDVADTYRSDSAHGGSYRHQRYDAWLPGF